MNTIMLSYSRRDEDAVKALARGFEAARRDVWFDHDLGGGDAWWDAILESIRTSAVFLFALSDAALHSKPCRLELDYALALQRPVLPVRVGPISSLRTNPLAELQIIEYDPLDARSGFAVLAAVDDAAARVRPLPDPLPPPPPIPFAYLLQMGRRIESTELSTSDQVAALDQLRRALDEETDESVRQDILSMLHSMKAKPWTTRRSDREIAALLYAHGPEVPPESAEPAGPEPEPDTREWFAQRMEQLYDQRLGQGEQPGWSPPADANPRWWAGPEDASSRDDTGPEAARPAWPPAAAASGPQPAAPPAGPQPVPESGGSARGREWAESRGGQPWAGPAWGQPPGGSRPAEPWRDQAPGAGSPGRQEPGSAGAGAWSEPQPGPRPGAGQQVAGPAQQPPGRPPGRHLVLCVLGVAGLFGVVALVYSAQVGRRLEAQDGPGAERASRTALTWAIVGIGVAILLWVVPPVAGLAG
jgi:TIR domain/Interferon-induced transmembrane protein